MRVATEVLISITSGVLLADFPQVHQACEFLCGEPVWTHQFAFPPFVEELKKAVLSQCPEFKDVDVSAVNKSNWQEFRDQMIERFGRDREIVPATSITKHQEAFVEPLKGKRVIGVEV